MKSIVIDEDANDKLKRLLAESVDAAGGAASSRTGLLIGSVNNIFCFIYLFFNFSPLLIKIKDDKIG
jgi:hypothetical protein